MYNIWGHIITDDIRRVWFLKSEHFKQFKDYPMVYVPWSVYRQGGEKSFRQLLKILEVDFENLRPIMQPTQFDKIILPDSSFRAGGIIENRFFTNEYRETIDMVRSFAQKNRTPTSIKKIYNYYGNNQVGEERLAEYFKTKGYEIIRHEQRINFDEYFNLLINCESFVSTLGSCAHDSVFLRDNTEAIFITRWSGALGDYQPVIDQVRSLNATYIDTSFSVFRVRTSNFCFVISEPLKRFFGDKWNGYDEADFKAFLQYEKKSLIDGRVFNAKPMKGYGAVFTDFMDQLKRRKDLIAAYNMPPDWDKFRPQLTYQTHVHMNGWNDGLKLENQASNPLEQMLDVLAIKVNYPAHKVYYQVYFSDAEGWSEEVTNNQQAGTVGKRKPIYGMRVRFDEAGAKEYDILYRMHKFDGTWTAWAKNGEALYSHGQSLNAIQMKLEPVNSHSDKAEKIESESLRIPNNENGDMVYLQRQDLTLL